MDIWDSTDVFWQSHDQNNVLYLSSCIKLPTDTQEKPVLGAISDPIFLLVDFFSAFFSVYLAEPMDACLLLSVYVLPGDQREINPCFVPPPLLYALCIIPSVLFIEI